MRIVISVKAWGGATFGKGGKIKRGKKKPRDASEGRRWGKSTKQTVVSRAKAKGLQP